MAYMASFRDITNKHENKNSCQVLPFFRKERANNFHKVEDTHWEKAPTNKTPALVKSINMEILVVGTSNQL